MRLSVVLIVPLLSALAASDQRPGTQPVFPTQIHEVRVFVRAEARGVPVVDLRPDEFEVRDDGKRVSNVRIVSLGRVEPGSSSFGREAREPFVPGVAIIVDDFLATDAHVAYVRDRVREFVVGLVGERIVTLVAPASGSSASGRTPGDIGRVIDAIDALTPSVEYRRVFFPGSDRTTASPAELMALSERMREARVAAVAAAAESLASVSGDRVVLLVSPRGMTYASSTGRATYESMLESVRRAKARLFALVYRPQTMLPDLPSIETKSVPVESRLGPPSSMVANPRRRSFDVDPRASTPLDLSHALAIDTGGYSTRGALDSSLNEVAREMESHYVIAFERRAPPDGRFHKLEVRVKRKDVRVRHRSGYFAH